MTMVNVFYAFLCCLLCFGGASPASAGQGTSASTVEVWGGGAMRRVIQHSVASEAAASHVNVEDTASAARASVRGSLVSISERGHVAHDDSKSHLQGDKMVRRSRSNGQINVHEASGGTVSGDCDKTEPDGRFKLCVGSSDCRHSNNFCGEGTCDSSDGVCKAHNADHVDFSKHYHHSNVHIAHHCPLVGGEEKKFLPDEQITASSYLNGASEYGNGTMFRARLDWTGHSWESDCHDKLPYLQYDFRHSTDPSEDGKPMIDPGYPLITAINTKGSAADSQHWVTEFRLLFSNDTIEWIDENETYVGNEDKDTTATNYLRLPFAARYMRIVPMHCHEGKPPVDGTCEEGCSMRAEIFSACTESQMGDEDWHPHIMHRPHVAATTLTTSIVHSDNVILSGFNTTEKCRDSPSGTGLRFFNSTKMATCHEVSNYCYDRHSGHLVRDACLATCGYCEIKPDAHNCTDGAAHDHPVFELDQRVVACSDLRFACNKDPRIYQKCKQTCNRCHVVKVEEDLLASDAFTGRNKNWWNSSNLSDLVHMSKEYFYGDMKIGCSRRRQLGWCHSRRRRV